VQFAGIYQILHTPFDDEGRIDWESYARQIEFCVKAGIHGLVVPAMASEFFALSDAERFESVNFALKAIDHRVPAIVGVQAVSLPVAITFAEHAISHGADGLMAMPPYLRKAPQADVEIYFQTLSRLGLPLIIQNAPAPVGSPLSPGALASLLEMEDGIAYVKEESMPILQKISRIKSLAGANCQGIFGGANGLYLLDELQRGACGNMPAGGFADVQVKIYELYVAGEKDAAEALQLRLLPLLTYASMYGVTLHKYLLHKRGILASDYARDPQQIPLDDDDKAAVDYFWNQVADEAIAVS
jgi:4-hydroxy-tetrahydrodipicolinate synthase